jgi:hypothetical protein
MGDQVVTAKAWAVKDGDGWLDVRTVSPTRISAIINWLVCGKCNGMPMMVSNSMSDMVIEEHWLARCGRFSAQVVQIELREVV